MLQAAQFAVAVGAVGGEAGGDQAEAAADVEQGDVAEVVGEDGVFGGVAEHEVLDEEFDVDQAARIVLQLEGAVVVLAGVAGGHLLAHAGHFATQRVEVARLAQDFLAHALEAGAQRGVAGGKARPCQRLVLPHPGVLELVVTKAVERADQQARIAVRAQTHVGVIQTAGGSLARQPGVDALHEA